jgi:predicted transcriptional regulator
MARTQSSNQDVPDLQSVVTALYDPDCRTIIRTLDGQMRTDEIAEAADIPLSTAYRKLDLLTEASLLKEETDIRPDGQHTSSYRLAFEEVIIGLAENREFEIDIE